MDMENGEFCLEPANYSNTQETIEPGLAYLQGDEFPQNSEFDPSNINLLNLLNMPNCSPSSSSSNIPIFNSASFLGVDLPNAGSACGASFEPLQLHLNLTPQQQSPSFFQIDGGAYDYGAAVLTSMSMGDEYGDGGGRDISQGGGGGGNEALKHPKNFVTERQRRQTFNDKFQHLRSLLPNPNKNDRASIVGDAIEYIKELIRTVKELQILVDKKRCSKQRLKRYKTTTTAMEDNDTSVTNAEETTENAKTIKSEQVEDQSSSLRSSWLQRKCKDTEIDVRIVDDEVTIKLVQRKKTFSCLLSVSRTFDELQLDLHHVTGGHVGDYYSFLFNTKILEGSSVYASAIANKLIEVVERQYAGFP